MLLRELVAQAIGSHDPGLRKCPLWYPFRDAWATDLTPRMRRHWLRYLWPHLLRQRTVWDVNRDPVARRTIMLYRAARALLELEAREVMMEEEMVRFRQTQMLWYLGLAESDLDVNL